MKTIKKLALVFLAFSVCNLNFSAKALPMSINAETHENTSTTADAEYLYEKINDFLVANSNVSPEMFDDVCKKYMSGSIKPENLLNETEFKKISDQKKVLYRGLSTKQFADDLKRGNVYIAPNTKNVRGMGLYTTSSLKVAKEFSDKTSSSTVVQILFPKANIKVLENDYLEKLKETIRTNHKEEFGELSSANKNSFVFDSMSEYFDAHMKELFEKIKNENIHDEIIQQQLLSEMLDKIKSDPLYQNLQSKRKKYFKTNKASIFYNSGLLTKLLGFDVLHSNDFLNDSLQQVKKDEYLIVNFENVYILKD